MQTSARLHHQNPCWFSVALIVSLLHLLPALHAEEPAEMEIHPFKSDSEALGDTAGAPYLSVNELTGKMRVTLPMVGVGDLSATPTYKLPNRRFLVNDAAPDEIGVDGPLAAGWFVDPGLAGGYISVKVAQMVSTNGGIRFEPEAPVYVDGAGNVGPFYRDGVFMEQAPFITPRPV